MRRILVVVAVLAGLAAAYGGTLAKNSFSSYSGDQLDLIEREYVSVMANGGTFSQGRSRILIGNERLRRALFPASIALSVLCFAGAIFVARGRRSDAQAQAPLTDEEARLRSAIGDPAMTIEAAKHKAAALLGVTRDAPPSVIEAALAAQLADRDPSKLDGRAPSLRLILAEQREELVKARNLLLEQSSGRPPSPFLH